MSTREQARQLARFKQMTIAATEINRVARGLLGRRRMQINAANVYVRFTTHDSSRSFWYNRITQRTMFIVPACLVLRTGSTVGFQPRACLRSTLPSKEQMFVLKCGFCDTRESTKICSECAETFCDTCFEDIIIEARGQSILQRNTAVL